MEQSEWVEQLASTSGAAIRKRRAALKLTAGAVAQRCTDLGFPISRQSVSRLEAGKRDAPLNLAELLVLARALDVPPVLLIAPLDQQESVRIAPDVEVPAAEALTWITGERPTSAAGDGPGAVLDVLRRHDRLVRTAVWSTGQAVERRRDAQLAGPDDYQRASETAQQLEDVARRDREDVLSERRRLRELGAFPPPLPSEIAFVDPTGAAS
ncbi:helix-turn-helix transcriptional regulator [Kitasatospora purpeofusca]|uniref:helix-turn-helix transcriptional regulator n=1 Tax=Kitasatospora purpeofusca TaxID=67352 RepID=UPI0035D56916